MTSYSTSSQVGYFHFAHSYVRGNWNKESDSSFSLMTKSCQFVLTLYYWDASLTLLLLSDIDVLCHWFRDQKPLRVSSFGSLSHFRKQMKPASAGSATRCLECPAESSCAYSAKKSASLGSIAPLLKVV